MRSSAEMTNVGAISGLQKPEGTEVEIKRKHAVLILGPPCSGKKNVRECLAGCGFYSYSSSEALSEYGRNYNPRVLQAMDSGDDVDIVDVIRVSGWQYQDFLAHREKGVFDGWGRNIKDIAHAVQSLNHGKAEITVVYLDAPNDVLLSRGTTRNRDDDHHLSKRIHHHRDRDPDIQNALSRNNIPVIYIQTSGKSQKQVGDEVLRKLGLSQ